MPALAYPARLPYRFSNFVWWNDEDLRVLLKKRIPGLGDEVATSSSAEGKVRDALTALLKERGIVAEVQSEEPSLSAFAPVNPIFFSRHSPEPPHPAIIFSLLEHFRFKCLHIRMRRRSSSIPLG
jgi:hypothetical protein